MSPELNAPKERKCSTCKHYRFKRREASAADPARCWRWAYCEHKQKWFPDEDDQPGERKGCDAWE